MIEINKIVYFLGKLLILCFLTLKLIVVKRLSLLLVVIIFIINSCGITPENAQRYNEQIINIQNDTKHSFVELEKAFVTFDSEEIGDKLGLAKKQTEMSLRNLTKVQCPDEDSVLHKATKDFFEICLGIINNEYTQMHKLYSIPDDEYGNEHQKKYELLKGLKNNKYRKAFKEFAGIQNHFVSNFPHDSLKLVKSEDMYFDISK